MAMCRGAGTRGVTRAIPPTFQKVPIYTRPHFFLGGSQTHKIWLPVPEADGPSAFQIVPAPLVMGYPIHLVKQARVRCLCQSDSGEWMGIVPVHW